jgi:uncharacterized protein YbjT (DUF2867 family)
MKYVITGSLGHIGRPLVQQLVGKGNDVSVITSNAERVVQIEALGATALLGSVQDKTFLKNAFSSADAAYTMVPPFFGAPDWKKYIASIGENYAEALRESTIKYVVNLSSIGAHMPEGCGPVSGLHAVENALNRLDGVHILHLRPGYFYYNFFGQLNLIKNLKTMGGNYGTDTKLVLSDTDDIAEAAASNLLNPNFTGKSELYLSSDEKTTTEVANLIGKEIGESDLKWIDFSDEESIQGLIQAGLPQNIAENYTEMGAAIKSGQMFEHYFSGAPKLHGQRSFATFAKTFAAFLADPVKQ